MKQLALCLALVASLGGGIDAQDVGPILAEGVVDAPVDAVWNAWATSEGLRSWLAPHAEIDLRVGGAMRTNYRAEGSLGDPGTIENGVLAFEPRRMLSIKVAKAPATFPFPNAVRQMWTVIYFDPAGPAQTRVRIVGQGFGTDDESQKMRAFFERGNAVTLQQLQRRFAATVQGQAKARTLLAVFAHPDDEQVVSPMLARYAREGVRVRLFIATDGQKGVRPHAGIAAGAALATARTAEARCATDRLGIEAPTLMGLEDGALNVEANKTALLTRLATLLTEMQPDVVVTWGPDGVTGHNDHRMVSNIVTEVVQLPGAATRPQLLYAGISSERLQALKEQGGPAAAGLVQRMAIVDDRYLPVRIAYTEADARAAAESLACHKTQYTPDEVAMMLRLTRAMENGAVRLRPWFVDQPPQTDLFK